MPTGIFCSSGHPIRLQCKIEGVKNVGKGTAMAKVIDKLVEAVRRAAEYNSASQVAPSCILWPDGDRQFESALPLLLKALPEMLALGSYDAENRTGPAIWLRCALGGKAEGYDPQGATPIVYLPGVSRGDLRVVESLPEEVRPLAYFAFRGTVFQQKNGKDWTALAFLVSKDGGLGLDVAGDIETKASLQTALAGVLEKSVEELSVGQIDSGDLDKTIAGDDTDRLVLQWLNGGDAWRKEQSAAKWKAFMAICKKTYGLNPEKDGQGAGLRRFAGRQGAWKNVFERYEECYTAYPQILPNLLLQTPPAFNMFDTEKECGGWPQWNADEEQRLLDVIKYATEVNLTEAAKHIKEAEARHAVRRRSVWAKMGQSPMAFVIRELVELADFAMASVPTFGKVEEMAAWYEQTGWKVDDAARRAVARAGKTTAHLAVKGVVRNFYKPWLEKVTNAFQGFFATSTYPNAFHPPKQDEGTWCIFADGLRLDVARELKGILEHKGYSVAESARWAPVPTVTACGKPCAVPGGKCSFESSDVDDSYDPLKTSGMSFAKYLDESGFEEVKPPSLPKEGFRAWWPVKENVDTMGHEVGESLPVHIPAALDSIAQCVLDAFALGAKKVSVVTDHGWLWLPGGLPKYELPSGLAKTKSKRYATVKPGVSAEGVELGWSWNTEERITFAPGICCHANGNSYIHGGLSLQECRLVDLMVTPVGAGFGGAVAVNGISWRGVRFTCELKGDFANCKVDFRLDPNGGESLLAKGARVVDADGKTTGLIADEELMGKAAYLVVLDGSGNVKAQNKVLIGGIES